MLRTKCFKCGFLWEQGTWEKIEKKYGEGIEAIRSQSPSEPEEVNQKAQWISVFSFMHTTSTVLTQGPMKSCRTLSFIFFTISPFLSPSSLSLLLPFLKYYGKRVWAHSHPNDSPFHEGNLCPWKPWLQRLCWPQSHTAAKRSLWCLALVVNLIGIRNI